MKRYLATAVMLIAVLLAEAQNIYFNHLTPDDGLSQISVVSLYADEDGVMWMATRVGLNSYDGNSIQVYRQKQNDSQSLFCNNVLRLTGDRQGHLYLLCTEGVARLDLHTRKFQTLKYSNNIGAICYHGGLYVSVGNTVQRMTTASGRFTPFIKLPGAAPASCLTVDKQGRLWIGTQGEGVYCHDRGRLTHPITEGNITTVYEDSRQELWIGSWNHGFWHIDRKGTVRNMRQGQQLVSDFVRAFCEDDQGDMWIGTFHGLMRYSPRTGKSQLFTANRDPGGLSNSSIWSIIKDQQGTLWIGTYFGGVNYFNPEYEIYTHYRIADNEPSGLSSQIVGRMTEDEKGNLWICTEGGGLNIYNRRTHRFTWHRYPGSMISQNNLKAIYFDQSRHTMWIGTHLGGLDRIDLATGRTTVYRHMKGDAHSLPSDIVRDIVPYGKYLYIATQEGVARMDPEKGTFTRLLPKERLMIIPSLCVDRQQRLWIATDVKGVYCYDLRRGTYRHFANSKQPGSLSCNNINNIMEDKLGRIWFSTANSGIDLWSEHTASFINYGEHEGLDADCVYTAVPSSLSNKDLLLITNHGFSVFDTQARTFRNYDRESGFPLATANENALYLTRDGEVFVGGVQGMVSFREKSLYKTTKPYRLGFSRLFVNGHEITPGDATGILKNTLSHTDKIVLAHNQAVFSIEYSTSNYIKANASRLLYRLEGSSDHWTPLRSGQMQQEFIGLGPGNYTLEIKSKREDVPVARLMITILPPWYLSWWAYILYFLLTALIVGWIVREYRNRIRLAESLKYEQQHVRDVEEQNQSKLRFFTNVSHEIRTPVTVITGLTELLLHSKDLSANLYNKVVSIYQNSSQLKELISELLDFRKQEQAHARLKVQEQDFVLFVQNISMLFKEYAVSKDINLVFRSDSAFRLWFDRKQMQKVVSNLISNALKHTPQGGTVTISVRCDGQRGYLSVADTGNGIAPKDLDRVFNRFYQAEQIESLAAIGTGIGLHLTKEIVELHHGTIRVDSELNRGTTFTVTLPQGNSHFSAEEIIAEKIIEPTGRQVQEHGKHTEKQGREQDLDNKSNSTSILIVEDNDDIRELLVTIFSPYYRCLTAVDGQEGLEMVKDEMPDIVLSDILMPNLSGTELCRAIKQDFSICHIPVVLLTARTAAEQAIEGLKTGADDYITKPFNNDLLVSRCNNLVNSRRMLQRKFSEHPHTEADLLATNPLDKDLLDRAMKIIDKHYSDPGFNVETFAQEMFMSRTTLFNKWRTLTGQTPKGFILNMRLRKAADMLRNHPELSISEISYMNGFSSPRYFCKCFKDAYKQQPSLFRNADHMETEKEEAE